MAVDYKKFLAENVLNERRTVTYRLLSRALKVHCSLAKQMLYEFHRSENTKKPNSVNATYVITGIQRPREPPPSNDTKANNDGGDEDEILQSSPYLPSSMPNQDPAIDSVATASIILAREEDLEEAKSTFQSISSIHVYSLQPTVLQDLNALTDASRELSSAYASQDPLEFGKQWGMIQNSHVKRRTGPPAPPTSIAAPSHAAPPKPTVPAKRPLQEEQPTPSEENKESKEEKNEEIKRDQDADSQPSQLKDTGTSTKWAERAAPKKEKNSLFSSFAKAKPKQKKNGSATPAASGAESVEPSGAEDVALDDASEEEPEELFAGQGKPTKSTPPPSRETKKEREDRLKKMMEDDDDEDMPDAPELPEPEEEASTEDQPPPKQPQLKEEVSISGGRRRGKRQVMKKKTVKDEEGYLVTVEEPTWESFSEDEPAPKKKPAVSSAPKSKPPGKPGQGNIMSFFNRK